MRLVLNSQALNGSQRVVLDDVITDDECSELSHLAHVSLLITVKFMHLGALLFQLSYFYLLFCIISNMFYKLKFNGLGCDI